MATTDNLLPINEVFQTLQGEAAHTGTPAIFVRLQGCGVGCPWCDTKHTWALRPEDRISVPDMLAKVNAAQTYALVGPEQLVDILQDFRARHVVITGGEPCMHDLMGVTGALIAAGFAVQIETSGTQPVRVDDGTWVTVSPKIAMPGGFAVRQDAMRRADEIKMPVGRPADVERLAALLADHAPLRGAVWLQPLSRSPRATALCVEAATERGWKVSVQVHAYIGVR